MPKAKVNDPNKPVKRVRPALTDESIETQMIGMAYDLVRQRLLDGTASSQETTHFLKLGTEKARLENKLLAAQAEMALAKKEALQSQKRTEELFADAIKAFKSYSYNGSGDDDDEEE